MQNQKSAMPKYIKQKEPILFPKDEYSPEDIKALQKKAFIWASKEQEHFCPKADRGYATENCFKDAAMKYGLHQSFFCDPDDLKTVYLRMWWTRTNEVAYAIIENGNELRNLMPSLFDQMVRNGLYAYLKAEQPHVCSTIFGRDRA